MSEQEFGDWAKNEEGLREYRAKLAGWLGVEEVPDVVWEDLLYGDEGYVHYAYSVGGSEKDTLVKKAKRLLKIWRSGGGQQPPSSERLKETSDKRQQHVERGFSYLNDYEAQREKVVEQYLAEVAACHPGVQNYRRWFLGGEVLSREEALAFLASPANAYLTASQLEEYDISPWNHTATSEGRTFEQNGESVYAPAEVFIDHPRVTLPVERRPTVYLEVPDEDGHARKVWVSELSVLDQLRGRVADLLATMYPWQKATMYPWGESQVVWFVLTGEPPEVPALTSQVSSSRRSIGTYTTITLTVAPWVSPETVSKFYSHWRKRIYGSKYRSPSSARKPALVSFVMERGEFRIPGKRRREKGKPPELASRRKPELVIPSYATLRKAWNGKCDQNDEYPTEWRYNNRQPFHHDFNETFTRIVGPGVKVIGPR